MVNSCSEKRYSTLVITQLLLELRSSKMLLSITRHVFYRYCRMGILSSNLPNTNESRRLFWELEGNLSLLVARSLPFNYRGKVQKAVITPQNNEEICDNFASSAVFFKRALVMASSLEVVNGDYLRDWVSVLCEKVLDIQQSQLLPALSKRYLDNIVEVSNKKSQKLKRLEQSNDKNTKEIEGFKEAQSQKDTESNRLNKWIIDMRSLGLEVIPGNSYLSEKNLQDLRDEIHKDDELQEAHSQIKSLTEERDVLKKKGRVFRDSSVAEKKLRERLESEVAKHKTSSDTLQLRETEKTLKKTQSSLEFETVKRKPTEAELERSNALVEKHETSLHEKDLELKQRDTALKELENTIRGLRSSEEAGKDRIEQLVDAAVRKEKAKKDAEVDTYKI